MIKKLLLGVLSENRSMGASMIAELAQNYGWEVDIEFIPPHSDAALVKDCIGETETDFFALSGLIITSATLWWSLRSEK